MEKCFNYISFIIISRAANNCGMFGFVKNPPSSQPRWCSGLRSASRDGVWPARIGMTELAHHSEGGGRTQIGASPAPRAPGISAVSRVHTTWRRRMFLRDRQILSGAARDEVYAVWDEANLPNG